MLSFTFPYFLCVHDSVIHSVKTLNSVTWWFHCFYIQYVLCVLNSSCLFFWVIFHYIKCYFRCLLFPCYSLFTSISFSPWNLLVYLYSASMAFWASFCRSASHTLQVTSSSVRWLFNIYSPYMLLQSFLFYRLFVCLFGPSFLTNSAYWSRRLLGFFFSFHRLCPFRT